jgi:hypothetical protein
VVHGEGAVSDACPDCGQVPTFDPLAEGITCGGVAVAGAMVCDCGPAVCRQSVASGPWSLAKSGRSVDADGTRIRCEAAPNAAALMARVARLPELERALRAIAAGAPDAAAVARAALGQP